jgi:predicted nuclease of restriction endonuclease-like (RecB) superfamily
MSRAKRVVGKQAKSGVPGGYTKVLADLKRLIADSRHRALATVNRELVCLYWHIGRTIVQQQEQAKWGDAVVEQLSADLRMAFPDMKGFGRDNVFRMRQLFISYRELDRWLQQESLGEKVGTVSRQLSIGGGSCEEVGTASRQMQTDSAHRLDLSGQLSSPELAALVSRLSWSHHTEICSASDRHAERYFYMAMAVRERWSVRELRRQIDSALFLRYMSVQRDPEKCLPDDAESGDLLPFKDHYILEFLGLTDEHSERELRQAVLANLRDFFLEFGRDLTFVGDEYAITVGNDTFYIDLLFFHRRLQCLLGVKWKIGEFKPEYVGKSQFYCAALDERVKLEHENPSIGLVLCKTADHAQVRLALTAAARKIGVATYQTALPDEKLIRARLEHFAWPREDADG